MRVLSGTTAALLCAFASFLPANVWAGATSAAEKQAILAAAEQYVLENSAAGTRPKLKLERVEGDFARVAVTPAKGNTDPAVVFLRKTAGKWRGLVLGTAFAPGDYDELHIPKSLRQ